MGSSRTANDALIVHRSASPRMHKLKHNLAGDAIDPNSLFHDHVLCFDSHAAAAVAGAVAAGAAAAVGVDVFAGACKTRCRVLLRLSLPSLPRRSHFSLSVSPD